METSTKREDRSEKKRSLNVVSILKFEGKVMPTLVSKYARIVELFSISSVENVGGDETVSEFSYLLVFFSDKMSQRTVMRIYRE